MDGKGGEPSVQNSAAERGRLRSAAAGAENRWGRSRWAAGLLPLLQVEPALGSFALLHIKHPPQIKKTEERQLICSSRAGYD